MKIGTMLAYISYEDADEVSLGIYIGNFTVYWFGSTHYDCCFTTEPKTDLKRFKINFNELENI